MNKRQKLAQKRQMEAEGYGYSLGTAVFLIFVGLGIFAMFMQLLEQIVKQGAR